MPLTPPTDDSVRLRRPLRILHLEDDAADAALIAWTLRTAGIQCRVIRVEDEESYTAALRESDLDLILSDRSVPGFSGPAALEMALTAGISAPFVFICGDVTREMRAKALKLGAADCLSKEHRSHLVFLAQRIWQNKSPEG